MSIITERKHPIIEKRSRQQQLNALAYVGGADYVHARLVRAPNESDFSWRGRNTSGNSGGWDTGRRDRAVCHREGGRVADKINQYLFSKPVQRAGVDEAFALHAGTQGESLAEVWEHVSRAVTLNGWCWVAIQQPAIPDGMSLKAAQEAGLGVRLAVLAPWEVPDWHFKGDGTLEWAITEATVRDDADPEVEAKDVKVRTLWQRKPEGLVVVTYHEDKEHARATYAKRAIPLVLVGKLSADPWWFDEVENVQAQLLNLASLHHENLTRAVYPQLVIPDSTFQNLEMKLVERSGGIDSGSVIEVVKEMTRSADAPIVEGAEDKGITRYICPSANDLNAIPQTIKSERFDLFDSVGLAQFNRELRSVQSAESKAFDHLDTNATLRQRANLLQTAERAVVAKIRELDPNFAAYEPVYNADFDVSDVTADAQALVQVGNVPGLTLSQRKVLLRAATHVIGGICPISEEEQAAINAEIDELTDDAGLPTI